MNETNPKVDEFFARDQKWREEYTKLRTIVKSTGLSEEYKWMHPTYTLDGKNIVLIHGFKEYCALLFINGALLKDKKGILIQQTENVQAGRQVRFTNLQQIVELEPVLKEYIQEAIELEKSGVKVVHKETEQYTVPEELQVQLNKNPDLNAAFKALTPGRQRAYLFFFAEPKLSQTRQARIEKYIPQILAGKGLND